MLLDQFFPQGDLIVVQETKLKEIDLACLIEVDLVEQESVVGKRNVETDFVHALNKLLKIQLARKIFIHTSETLSKTFEFLNDPVVCMLD